MNWKPYNTDTDQRLGCCGSEKSMVARKMKQFTSLANLQPNE
jgi:hypothetical protein